MDFSLSEEQQLLKDSVQRFVRDEYELESRRKLVASDTGYSEENWAKMAELGWLAMPLPEEFGGIGGGNEVAHHRQFTAAAKRIARHRRNHRLAAPRHPFPIAGDEVIQIGIHVAFGLHLLDVGAGGEGLLGTGYDDAADFGVGLEIVQRRRQLLHQGV